MNAPAVNFAPLVKSISIENLLAQRDGIRQRLIQAIGKLKEAEDIAERSGIADAVKYRGFNFILQGPDRYRDTELLDDDAVATVMKRLDANAWQHLLHESGIRTLMDATARKEWDDKIANADVPELTAENIKATFGMLYQNRGEIFERGVVKVFRDLSWCYKTNRPFAFGKRIVIRFLRHSVTGNGSSLGWPNDGVCNKLDDLLRVFSVLDGKPEPDHRGGFYHLLYGEDRRNQREVENAYMQVRSFRNGNGHITFKRPDLVTKMNQILAKHFPAMLPDDRHEEAVAFQPVRVA